MRRRELIVHHRAPDLPGQSERSLLDDWRQKRYERREDDPNRGAAEQEH